MARLTDRPDMIFNVYRGRKTTTQQFIQVLASVGGGAGRRYTLDPVSFL